MTKTLLLQGIKCQKDKMLAMTLLMQEITYPIDGQNFASVANQVSKTICDLVSKGHLFFIGPYIKGSYLY